MTDVVQRLNTALDGRYRIEREHGILVLDRWIGERYVVEARLLEVTNPRPVRGQPQSRRLA